jgi:hypothetical protein
MPNDSVNDEKEFLDRVRTELQNRGRILELQTFQTLRRAKWDCAISVPYSSIPTRFDLLKRLNIQTPGGIIDSERDLVNDAKVLLRLQIQNPSTVREFDILARKNSDHGSRGWWSVLEAHLVIECKSRKEETWVFVMQSTKPKGVKLQPKFRKNVFKGTLLNLLKTDDAVEYADVSSKLTSVSHHNRLPEYSRIAYPIFTSYKGNNIREACEQVTRAAEFHYTSLAQKTAHFPIESQMGLRSIWQLYPLIIFDGPIVEAFPTGEDVKLTKRPWVTYLHERPERDFLVDIVQSSHFVDYLKIVIDEELERFKKVVKDVEQRASSIRLKEVDILETLPTGLLMKGLDEVFSKK